jgi:hypothetical protein
VLSILRGPTALGQGLEHLMGSDAMCRCQSRSLRRAPEALIAAYAFRREVLGFAHPWGP